MEGRILPHYRVLERLGGGGMGVVYKAEDVRLKRAVALKFLPPELTRDDEARERFIQEAQAASALDHPNICTIHEIDTTPDDQLFIAMAYYDGETLSRRITRGPLPVADALDIALQVAQGLSKAHGAGIVHRDVKPGNLMITNDGLVKIVDFGIAKLLGHTGITRTGTSPGTVAYMSPEQIEGSDVDQRTDLWSLGVVLYEMLAGHLPFCSEHPMGVINAIVNQVPAPLIAERPEIPVQVERLIGRALEKERAARYVSATEFRDDLARCLGELTTPREAPKSAAFSSAMRPAVVVPALVAIAAIAVTAIWAAGRGTEARRARQEAVPQVLRLLQEDNYSAAFVLAEQAERSVPGDRVLDEIWPQISRRISVTTTPNAASVSFAAYTTEREIGWTAVGQSPALDIRVPRGAVYLRIEKPGFESVRTLLGGRTDRVTIALDPTGSIPPRMVRIAGGELSLSLAGFDDYPRVTAPSYLIDKYEVTNREFKAFVDAGGYRNREYWQHNFVKGGRPLRWEEAMAEFRDRTGRPGPSTWEAGTYPQGHDDYPVAGVSWYEAAAYAAFAGRSLPTVFHWLGGTATAMASYVLPHSNFSGNGLVAVGSYLPGPQGTYDMAGNVKEWCLNQTGPDRMILGAAWNEPTYLFFERNASSPFDRSQNNGFRTVDYLNAGTEPLQASIRPIERVVRNYDEEIPVADDIFRTYADQFTYDPAPLNATVESIDESSPFWRREKVSFDAAYGRERVVGYLFLPKNVAAPHQTVIYFPGSGMIRVSSSQSLPEENIDFIIKSGRAVLWPVYKDSFERQTGLEFTDPNPSRSYAEHVAWWVKDVKRSVDYLATRSDIAIDKLAYLGNSWGGRLGSIVLAVEPRVRVGVLQSGGFPLMQSRPEVREINFAPRVTQPVLMVNGRTDGVFPYEASQKPMFRFLGTSEGRKKHILYDTGHALLAEMRSQVVSDVLTWLDTYLGVVN